MTLSSIDIAIVGIYAVSIFALAQWVSREKGAHKKDAQDYFLAGRALPWWAIGTSLPFMDRAGLAFLACFALAVVISLAQPRRESALRVELKQINYSTSAGLNAAALAITAILTGLYVTWW